MRYGGDGFMVFSSGKVIGRSLRLFFVVSFVLLAVSCGGGGSPQEETPATNSPPTVTDANVDIQTTATVGSVIATLVASDSDGDSLSYAISSGNAQGYFDIDASGNILLAAAPAAGSYALTVTVSDGTDSSQATVTINVTAGSTTPVVPRPKDVAPAIDTTVIESFSTGISFLYDGADPVQFGADAAAIDPQRVIVIRGEVLDGATSPASAMQNVRVEVKDHPESGYTLTRDDGRFDIAVNGGGDLVLQFSADGYLKAQRKLVATPWNDFVQAPDLVLVPLDSMVTNVSFGASTTDYQVARGSTTSDNNPERTPTLLIPPGTVATMVLPGGDEAQSQLDLRMTEYTVGDEGPQRMVGDLPPTSGYTYAVEISADQALAQGADTVNFNQPVYYYLDNYRGFPVGGIVPNGYYDFDCACWVPSENGLVIKIVSITGGLVDVDIDGDDSADVDLTSIGMSDAERTQLAALYAAGTELFRVPLSHLTAYDHNWPFDLPWGAEGPDTDPDGDDGDPCSAFGSIVNCTAQTLGERIELPGTGLALHYNSEYVRGFAATRSISLPIAGPTPPLTAPDSVRIWMEVAGRQVADGWQFSYDPTETIRLTWDGLDAYDRPVQGMRYASMDYAYVYPTAYAYPASSGLAVFAQTGTTPMTVAGPDAELFKSWIIPLDNFQAKEAAIGLGGWTLDIHHSYDAANNTVYRGDGGKQKVRHPLIDSLEIASPAYLVNLESVVSAPDGSLFFNYDTGVFKRNPDGSFEQIAGVGSQETSGNGGPALEAGMKPGRLFYAQDGSIYFVDYNRYSWYDTTLRRLYLQDGEYYVEHVATQSASYTSSGDGGQVAAAEFRDFSDFVVGPDNALYIADYDHVRRVAPDGIVTTFAGGGSTAPDDGVLATDASFIQVFSIDFDTQGNLYLLLEGASGTSSLLYKVLADGSLAHVAGSESAIGTLVDQVLDGLVAADVSLPGMDDVKLAPDGSIYLSGSGAFISDGSDSFLMDVVRHITPDGYISTYAGNYSTGASNQGDGEAANVADLYSPGKVALVTDGRVVIPSTTAIRVVEAAGAVVLEGEEHYHVASNTTPEVFVFDPVGRHLLTRHALTGAELYRFEYDSGSGLLSRIVLGTGESIELQRDSNTSLRIVGAGGHESQLSMDAEGYLQYLTLPGLQQYSFSYLAGGLLESASFPDGVVSSFEYDSTGRLLRDSNTQGLDLRLTRTALNNGFEVNKDYYDGGVLSKQETYRTEIQGEQMVSTYISSSGGSNKTTFAPNGTTRIEYPDGSVSTMKFVADPRWGMMAPRLGLMQVEQPSGLTRSFSETVTVDVDPNDIYGLNSQTLSKTVNGSSSSSEQYLRQTSGADTVHQMVYTSPMGRVRTVTMDELGRDLRIQRAGLDDRVYSYNLSGQLESAAFGSEVYNYGYDALTRLLSSSTDLDGLTTLYSFDANAFSSRIEPPSGNYVDMTHDAEGRLAQLVPPKGAGYEHSQTWRRDGMPDSYTPPGSVATRNHYTGDGRRSSSDVDAGTPLTQTYAYDALFNLASIADDLGSANFSYVNQSKAFDVAGYDQQDAAGLDQTTDYDYDGSLLSQMSIDNTGAGSDLIEYDYDDLFRATAFRFNPGSENIALTLGWSDDDLLTQYGDFTLTRNASSALVEAIGDATVNFAQTHNTRGYLTGRTQQIAAADDVSLALDYQASGRLSSSTLGVGGTSSQKHYVYDVDRQLTQVKATASTSANLESYSYDANGNITAFSYDDGAIQNHSVSYNERDQVATRDGIAYSYDDRGSLSSRGSDSFVYDTQGRLLTATVGATTIRYGYDALGRRTSRSDASGTTEYFYGIPGNALLISHIREADGTLVVLYYDSDARLIAFDRVGASTDRYYAISDYAGSPLVISDASGNVVIQREYTAYGIRFNHSNSAGFDSPLGFAGGLEDEVTGLVRFGMRDYEPLSAHWTMRDPILFDAGQANVYAYAMNDPVNNRDLSGLFCVSASVYEVFGGGGELCVDETGFSACGKVGVGTGGGFGFSPTGGTASTGASVGTEASAGIGPAGASAGVEIGPEGLSCGLSLGLSDDVEFKVNASAEAYAKYCQHFGG
jgi:RHS repeat-associated protein